MVASGSNQIRSNIEFIEQAANRLLSAMTAAAPLWADKQSAELGNAISAMSSSTVQILRCGEECIRHADRIEQIAQERY